MNCLPGNTAQFMVLQRLILNLQIFGRISLGMTGSGTNLIRIILRGLADQMITVTTEMATEITKVMLAVTTAVAAMITAAAIIAEAATGMLAAVLVLRAIIVEIILDIDIKAFLMYFNF